MEPFNIDAITEEFEQARQLFPDELAKLIEGLPLSKVQPVRPQFQSRRSRYEFEKKLSSFPMGIKKKILEGSLKVADITLYSIQPFNDKQITFFESSEQHSGGISNVNQSKLPEDEILVVYGIFVLCGVANSNIADDILSTKYESIGDFPGISNGTYSIEINGKLITLPNQPLRKFASNMPNLQSGYIELDNPFIIQDETSFSFRITPATSAGIPEHMYLWVGFDGTGTINTSDLHS